MRPPSSPEAEATATAWGGPRSSPSTPVAAVAAVSVLVVVALWASNGNVAELGQGPGAALTSLGRLCGLVASNLLLLQVLAMARIPWVERALGQDTVARWHRLLGFTSINLMLAHLLAVKPSKIGRAHV